MDKNLKNSLEKLNNVVSQLNMFKVPPRPSVCCDTFLGECTNIDANHEADACIERGGTVIYDTNCDSLPCPSPKPEIKRR